MTTRTITVATVNLGRGVRDAEFRRNADNVFNKVPGPHRFFGFQEVDEADKPEEFLYLKRLFRKTHRFVGSNTAVPIAVPRTFEVKRRIVTFASAGVAEFSPHRQLVQAVVHPKGKPDDILVDNNIHLGRNVPQLKEARGEATEKIQTRLKHWAEKDFAAVLTGDLNARNFKKLGDNEKRFVSADLDYVRGYPAGGVKMELLKTGTVDLTIDGHDAEWARIRITWP